MSDKDQTPRSVRRWPTPWRMLLGLLWLAVLLFSMIGSLAAFKALHLWLHGGSL